MSTTISGILMKQPDKDSPIIATSKITCCQRGFKRVNNSELTSPEYKIRSVSDVLNRLDLKNTNLVMVLITREVNVINPNLAGCLNSNGISSLSQDLGDLQVAQDNVGLLEHTKPNSNKSCSKR